MTAENQVAKEVVEIGEKSGLDVSPHQDLPKPNCNGSSQCDQVNGLENSYILVTEANGISDDHAVKTEDLVAAKGLSGRGDDHEVEKEDLGAAKGLSVESKVPVDVQIERLDLLDEEVVESIKEGENERVKSSIVDLPVVKGNDTPLEAEKLPEDGDGIPAVADAPEEQSEETESLVALIKSVEVPTARVESLVEAETDVAADFNENSENIVIAVVETENPSEKAEIDLVAEIKSFEVSNGKIESLVESGSDAVVDQIVDSENVVETEMKPLLQYAESLVTVALPTIEDPKSLGEEAECVVAEIKSFEVPKGKLESLVNAETEVIGERNSNLENVVEFAIKTLAQDAQAVVTVPPEEQKEESESGVAEMKLVESLNGTLQSLSDVETVTVEEKNGNSKNVMEIEIKPSIEVAESVVTVPTYEQGEETESDVVAEIDSVKAQSGRPESLLVEIETETVATEEQSEETQSDLLDGNKSVEVPNGRSETLVEVEKETVPTYEQSEETESDVVAEIDSVEVQNGRPESLVEIETETVATEEQREETQSDLVAGIKSVEVPNGRPDSLVEVEHEKVATAEQSEETESDVLAAIDSVEVQNGRPESSDDVETETVATEEQSEETQSDLMTEIKSVEVPNGRPEILVEVEKETVATKEQSEETKSDVVAELESVEVPNGCPESFVEVETETVATEEQSEETKCDVVAEIESLEVPTGRPESLVEFETEIVATKEQSEEAKSDVVAEIVTVDFPNVRIGNLIEVKTETVVEQNGNSENVIETEIKSPIQDAETLTVGSPRCQDPESQVLESGNPGLQDSRPNCTNCDPTLGSEFVPNFVDVEKKEPAFECGDEHVDNEVVNEASEALVHESSASTTEVVTTDASGTCVDEILDVFDVNTKDSSNLLLQKEESGDLKDKLVSSIGNTDEASCLQENASSEKSESDTISTPSPEDSSNDVGKDTSIVAETKPLFTCVFKVPRFGDESLKERIRHAKEKVDEKTKLRDDIQVQIQEKRATIQTHGMKYDSAKREDRDARRLVREKRMEIDSIQYVINKAKNAESIGDIDDRLYGIEYKIQHETVPLKEEKLLIREIKQLKQHREQLSASLGTADDIQKALNQKEDAEKQLKILRKELDVLKDNVVKAEAIALEAERKYDHEIKEVKDLQAAYRAADDVRQEAFSQWLSLKKELTEKNKCFFKYKDDAAAAYNYGQQGEIDSVDRVCFDQIEKMMELWNTNVEFRKEYINANVRSTVWRFGNLDSRGVGPGEKPHILPSDVNERFQRKKTLPTPAPKVEDSISQTPAEPNAEKSIDKEASDDKPLKKLDENKNQTVKTVKTKGAAAKPVPSENGLAATVSGRDAEVEVVEEEPVKSKEEIELERKAEETRKSEAEAVLRKQRIADELTRANEARERKKRQAEKLQARALMKAQKEAEQKEKEREKRMRKKERKKTKGTNVNDNDQHSDPVEVTVENGVEEETVEEITPPTTSVVNNRKQSQKLKQQIKSKSTIPPPLRNRNKKKWQQYMYVAAACLLVLVLFLLGNMGFFSAKTIKYSESSA